MYYRYIGFIKLNYNRYIDYILIQSYPSIASSRFLVTPGPRGFGPAAGWGSLDVQMAFLGGILWGFIVVWCFFSIRPKLDLLEFLDIFGSVSWITKGEPPKKAMDIDLDGMVSYSEPGALGLRKSELLAWHGGIYHEIHEKWWLNMISLPKMHGFLFKEIARCRFNYRLNVAVSKTGKAHFALKVQCFLNSSPSFLHRTGLDQGSWLSAWGDVKRRCAAALFFAKFGDWKPILRIIVNLMGSCSTKCHEILSHQ